MQRPCWEPRSWGGRRQGGARAARRMGGRRRGGCTRASPSIIFTPSLTVFYRHIGLFWDINKKRKEKNGSLFQICKEFQLWKWAAQPIVEVWVHWQCEAKPAQTGNTEPVLLPQGDVQVAIYCLLCWKSLQQLVPSGCTLTLEDLTAGQKLNRDSCLSVQRSVFGKIQNNCPQLYIHPESYPNVNL